MDIYIRLKPPPQYGMILSSMNTVKHYLYFDSKGLQIGKVLEYTILPLGSCRRSFGLEYQTVWIAKSIGEWQKKKTESYIPIPRGPITF